MRGYGVYVIWGPVFKCKEETMYTFERMNNLFRRFGENDIVGAPIRNGHAICDRLDKLAGIMTGDGLRYVMYSGTNGVACKTRGQTVGARLALLEKQAARIPVETVPDRKHSFWLGALLPFEVEGFFDHILA